MAGAFPSLARREMMSAADGSIGSPWITVWFSPRQTVERLVAARPTYFVWPLAVLGTVAGFYNQISVIYSASFLSDWQLALSLLLFGLVVGIGWLYLAGFMLRWIGWLLGGKASALHLRTAFAWSWAPTILGFALILIIDAATGRGSTLDAVPLLVAASSLWSFVIFLLMLGRVERFGFLRAILTYVFNLLLMLTVALGIRSFLYQPFYIPSRSMMPTLLVGDYVAVSKFAYGYSRFSLPFSQSLFSGRIFGAEPARGDVVVFRGPEDGLDYVKRVVGLPGDRIQMKGGELFINDVPVARERLTDIAAQRGTCGGEAPGQIKRWRETLPNGASYETFDCRDDGRLDNTDVFTVPPGQFFMLGDNRDNSIDSRVADVGHVPFENLIGRVGLIFFSREDDAGRAHVRFSRIGSFVR
jgi:signal peptidase I